MRTLFRTCPLIACVLLLSLLTACGGVCSQAVQSPGECRIDHFPEVTQQPNCCGPACIQAVFAFYDRDLDQQDIARDVYDPSRRTTHGARMLLYAREQGFPAYSWNSSISDVKSKLAVGVPVIVLQQNSDEDESGHYRVLVGYSDRESKFLVMDPYYRELKEISYSHCERLWRSEGYWALLIIPREKDVFSEELGASNAVVHLDLCWAVYQKGDYKTAMEEANAALKLEPRNRFALSMRRKIQTKIAAAAPNAPGG